MSDIGALEARITTALDRIRIGIAAQTAQVGADPTLQSALEEERAANAELVERFRALKEQQDTELAALSEEVEAKQAQLAGLDAELQNLRASNVQLRELNTQLREAVTQGLAPELLNDAAAAEVRALSAQRAADAAEVETVLQTLKPLLEETPNAAG